MGFPAKYSGICLKCRGDVRRGEMISWSRTKDQKGVHHLACDGGQVTTPKPAVIYQEDYSTREAKPITIADEKDDVTITTMSESEENKPMDAKTTEVTEALKVLMAAMAPKDKPAIDIEEVRRIVKESITEQGTLVIEVRQPSKESVKIDLAHNKLPDLIYFTSKRKHTYLHGPHGSGKSTGAQYAAKALGLSYGYISLTPQTPESRLLGYMNAMGGYVKTQYRDCYENGGVFCIDELDNGSPALLTTLNGALENGHMAFPDTLVTRHDDFVMVGTGNTSGRGANPSYPERRPFDSAFGDRFVYIDWQYDEKLECKIATGINKEAGHWVTWVLSVRRWAAKNHPRFVPSPRATFRLAEFTLDNTVSQENMLDAILWRGDVELKNKVLANCPLPV